MPINNKREIRNSVRQLADEIRDIMNFLHLAEKLKSVLRHSWLSSGRREDVAAHTWRMALMAILLHNRLAQSVNLEHVFKMIIVHDLPEVIADDHPAWDKTSENQYSDQEALGLKKLIKKLPTDISQEIYRLWVEYEENITAEARFVKALDKLEVVVQHNEAALSTWNEKEKDSRFNELHGIKECEYDPLLKELRVLVKQETIDKIKKGM